MKSLLERTEDWYRAACGDDAQHEQTTRANLFATCQEVFVRRSEPPAQERTDKATFCDICAVQTMAAVALSMAVKIEQPDQRQDQHQEEPEEFTISDKEDYAALGAVLFVCQLDMARRAGRRTSGYTTCDKHHALLSHWRDAAARAPIGKPSGDSS